ncbi:MAG: hypothetical protein KDC66_23635 [Phaeodactylibacter sp.]|nr:hypothetical protein [Phaeodactylibacter sp.]MCB9274932.1 hypothetical protein [Lewinellaceae bacterium]
MLSRGKAAGDSIQRDPEGRAPRDPAAVARARARLAVLEPRLTALQNERIRIEADRLRVLADRRQLDSTMVDPTGMPGSRQQAEDALIAQLNRRPLTIQVTPRAISISVRFQVFFTDATMASRMPRLTASFQRGLNLIWNQVLSGGVFGGRRLSATPSFVRIDNLSQRSQDYWLIHVRAADNDPIVYPGCNPDQPGAGVPTSVTDSTCDGGVMFIPPLHMERPGVLGHELLHLFGLVDRYVNIVTQMPGGRLINRNDPLRETRGRPDPLGAQDGPILREDLGYLFDRFGVYQTELQQATMGLPALEAEVLRLQEIIRLGYDPRSLIPIRRDFNDRLIRSVDDL